MAAESDSPKHLQPLDLIFSCNICHDSISDIPSPPPDEKELEGIRKPVAKLWMTECAHLICAKHLQGGAPPFHPAGQAPRAICPVCVNRQNNRALKQMYAVNGFSKGQHDSEIPQHFFQCPPVALDSKEGGMDALRFQFLGLVTYGIAVATKHRNLQTAHSHLKDQTDRMNLEKTEAETEIQTLTERITLAEEAERRYKAKEPEIKHYLEQFALVKKELDRRNEDLSALGYPPPRIDYTFPPSRLFEDDTFNGRATTSHTGPSERADRADPRIIEDHIPSVSSTTLRADSSRTCTEDDIQGIGNKRQKIADYRYIPQNMQSPSRDFSAQKRPGIRLPPASSITQKVPSRSTHFQPPPVPYQSNNSRFTFVNRSDDVRAGPQAMDTQHETWEPWGRTEVNRKPDTRSDDPPYMSGALQSDGSDFAKPAAPFRPPKQQKRKIQPVDSIDDVSRSDFITSERLPTNIPSHQQYDIGGDVDTVSCSTLGQPQESYNFYSTTRQHPLPFRGTRPDYHQHQSFEQSPALNILPRANQSPYRAPQVRHDAFRPPADRQSNRPYTPSPQHFNFVQQSDSISVTSPFFRADQGRNSKYHTTSSPMMQRTSHQTIPSFKMAPPRKPVPSSSQSRSQTMNGLSFVQHPQLDRDYVCNSDMPFDGYVQESATRALRDSNGLFVRPDMHQSSMPTVDSRHGTLRSSQYSNRPQPLPSRVPSLASSINIPREREGPSHDGALGNIRGVKGSSTSSKGMSRDMFSSRAGVFSSSRRSVRR